MPPWRRSAKSLAPEPDHQRAAEGEGEPGERDRLQCAESENDSPAADVQERSEPGQGASDGGRTPVASLAGRDYVRAPLPISAIASTSTRSSGSTSAGVATVALAGSVLGNASERTAA